MKRAPDFVIGPRDNPYLLRWWIIPRNRFFNIYLHCILADDDDRALHDHPFDNVSVLLKGSYREHLKGGLSKIVRRFRPRFRRAECAHRLEVVDGPVWSLFITGPRRREWYFHCPQGLVVWTDFVDARDTGKVGKGCGE